MTDVTKYFNNESEFLKAADLPQQGMVRVTINNIGEVNFGKDGVENIKPTIGFVEMEKKLSLNKTNTLAIAQVLGNEMEDWRGQQICIYATTTDFAGETVPCIRVDMPREVVSLSDVPDLGNPALAVGNTSHPLDDDIPF